MDASVGAAGSGASLPPWQLSDDMRRMGMLAWRWVAAYRDVLSQGQRWNERAMFDVQRAKLLAQRFEGATSTGALSAPRAASAASHGVHSDLDRQAFAVLVSLTTWAVPLPPPPQLPRAEALGPGLLQRHGPVVIAPAAPLAGDPAPAAALRAPVTIAGSRPDTVCTVIPGRTASEHAASLGLVPAAAALFVRCSSCGASLALPALLSHSASSVEWLSKQRPHMLSCPGCRKTLPRWCVSWAVEDDVCLAFQSRLLCPSANPLQCSLSSPSWLYQPCPAAQARHGTEKCSTGILIVSPPCGRAF